MTEDRITNHLEKNWKYYLGAILIFAFAIRLLLFLKYQYQSVWWDEADYLSIAKTWALGTPNAAPPYRAWGIAIFYAPIFWIGLGETAIKFLEVIFSTLGVYLTYLVGKEFFNKKVGLIAALGMSTYWVHLFWTPRISMGIIGLLFFCGAALCFYKGYVKKQGKKYLIAAGVLIGPGIIFYEAVGFIFPFLFLFLIVTERLKFLKSKKFWTFILAMFLAALPFLIANYAMHDSFYPRIDNMLTRTESTVSGESGMDWSSPVSTLWGATTVYFTNMPSLIMWGFTILLLIGLIYFIDMIFGFDLVLKNKSEKLKKDFYILLWPITFLIVIGWLVSTGVGFYYEPRFAFPAMPIIFAIAANGGLWFYNKFKDNLKYLAGIAVIALVIWGMVSAYSFGIDTLENKKDSFLYERDAGEWLAENTQEDEVILACSQNVPLIYYTGRFIEGFSNDNTTKFEEAIETYNPTYIVFDFYGPFCNSEYISQYEEHLTLLQAYFIDEAQTMPVILIYKYDE
mgnify:CR=1 FL=1|jgi:4-amino-4-deoxy-L-arabinose transferase-like glycosyltransferase